MKDTTFTICHRILQMRTSATGDLGNLHLVSIMTQHCCSLLALQNRMMAVLVRKNP